MLCPPLAASTWYLTLEYPLAAMLVVALGLLWRTRGFTRALPWPLLLLVLPGLVGIHKRGEKLGRWIVLALIYGTYILLSVLGAKMERYLMVIYPVLCLLVAFTDGRFLVEDRHRSPILKEALLAGVLHMSPRCLVSIFEHLPPEYLRDAAPSVLAMVEPGEPAAMLPVRDLVGLDWPGGLPYQLPRGEGQVVGPG